VSSVTARRAHARAGRRQRRPARRRRILAVILAAVLGATAAATILGLGPLGDAVREITLPLRHDDIIRQQARDKGLDPALIAAIIYEESKFRDQTSHAGARGLMQITPRTAEFIARDSGGSRFTQADLATPQINISYGSYYLRYLLRRYDRNEELAVAAYNAGETNVDRWVRRAGGPQEFDTLGDIPFPETRAYVKGVLDHREDYRRHYADELGL
jgi:soluble lytic murein transglycosylase